MMCDVLQCEHNEDGFCCTDCFIDEGGMCVTMWIEQAGLSEEDTADRARLLCWKVIEGCINVVKTQPTLTPPNEWVSVEDDGGENNRSI